MPIARVMNNPDGSTPVPPIGGGDVNGTLASSILNSQAGTAGTQISVPRQLKLQSASLGIPNAMAPQLGESMGQTVAVEEGGERTETVTLTLEEATP